MSDGISDGYRDIEARREQAKTEFGHLSDDALLVEATEAENDLKKDEEQFKRMEIELSKKRERRNLMTSEMFRRIQARAWAPKGR